MNLESSRLVKKCLEKFQSLGVVFTRMIGDKQYGNEAVLSVLHTAYANRAGVQFIQAVPDEHQSQGVVERFFQSGQRRAAQQLSASWIQTLQDLNTLG